MIILDSSRSASGGDVFPHFFFGPDPTSRVHDLGEGVIARIMGDIDGRLASGVKLYDRTPVSAESQTKTPISLTSEAGLVYYDRHGPMPLSHPWTQPDLLLPGWYDDTIWQDIGKTAVKRNYPIGDLKPLPVYEDRATWRDVWLENAIMN